MEDIYAFADDIAIICKELRQVNTVIDCIKNAERTSGITLNPLKSAIVKICKKINSKKILDAKHQGIPFKLSYKYLGVTIDYKLNYLEQIKNLKEKIDKIV